MMTVFQFIFDDLRHRKQRICLNTLGYIDDDLTVFDVRSGLGRRRSDKDGRHRK